MSVIKFNDYLNESKSEMNILDAIVFVLKKEGIPLSMLEIWSKISELNLLSKLEFDRINNAMKDGKVVGVYSGYLDTLLSRSSINTKRSDSNKKNLFEIVGSRPNMKYKLISKNEIKDESTKKYTFVEAAQLILKKNGNKPMTCLEIWEEASAQNLVETLGKTPKATMNAQMILYSDNTTAVGKKKNSIFRIIEDKPYKFVLINPELEVQSISDEDFEETPNVYCVRAGRGNSDAKIFLDGNFVGIDYDTSGFDISKKSKEEIIQFLSSKNENKRAIQQYIQQIELFKEIQDGDIILVPDDKGTNVGEVISNIYLYDSEEYPNRINVKWLEKIEKNSSLNIPKTVFEVKNFDTETMNFIGTEDDSIETFSTRFGIPTDFKAVQAQEEKESKEYVKNPFRQSICVLGRSGAGKSFTIDDILDKSEHEYEFIIPSASTTGLLSQFSPSAKDGRGGYIPSRLGKLIEKAYKNNNTLYTAVFDECHKSNIIEMINDELLQAISTERNKNRFISLDDETSDLYPSKVLDRRGNIEITDNLGFIFISSNARVISGNEDFFNRVDLVEITKADRDLVKTIKDLDNKRVKDTDEKYELVSKIMNETKR
jgi:hypothetical protein